jgi:uncharacterized membrane protein YphA (DoxX/SURF4 family)
MNNPKLVVWLLRIGIASVYLYAGVSSILNPNDWIAFLPPFISVFVPAATALFGIAVFQIILAIWLLTGFKTFYAALIAAFMILGIVVFNLNALEITFRDFTIFFASLALAAGTYKVNQTVETDTK